jgi:hypothetical protein
LILKSPVIERQDYQLVKSIAKSYPISDVNVIVDVNVTMKDQVDLEAAVVYLNNKYKANFERAEKEATLLKHRLQKKNGVRSVENHLDADYIELSGYCLECELLSDVIKDLAKIVIDRQKKLEQLSVNYRRESPPDYNR